MSTTREVVAEPAEYDEISLQVVTTVADLLGREPVDLEPLHRSIDTDALDALFADEADRPAPRVEFRTNGCLVTVEGDGRVVAHRTSND